ncbi:hypothetical protein ACEPPN_008565 [Leptodophora sp. 'Broadleaf-Isolate-01']
MDCTNPFPCLLLCLVEHYIRVPSSLATQPFYIDAQIQLEGGSNSIPSVSHSGAAVAPFSLYTLSLPQSEDRAEPAPRPDSSANTADDSDTELVDDLPPRSGSETVSCDAMDEDGDSLEGAEDGSEEGEIYKDGNFWAESDSDPTPAVITSAVPSLYEMMVAEENKEPVERLNGLAGLQSEFEDVTSSLYIDLHGFDVDIDVIICRFKCFDGFLWAEIVPHPSNLESQRASVHFTDRLSAIKVVEKGDTIVILGRECNISTWGEPLKSRATDNTQPNTVQPRPAKPQRAPWRRNDRLMDFKILDAVFDYDLGKYIIPNPKPMTIDTGVNRHTNTRLRQPDRGMPNELEEANLARERLLDFTAMMQEDIYGASPPTSPHRRQAAEPADVLTDAPSNVTATPAIDTNVDESLTPPADHADLPVNSGTPPAQQPSEEVDCSNNTHHPSFLARNAEYFMHADTKTPMGNRFINGLDKHKDPLLIIWSKVKAMHPLDSPKEQVMRIIWTQLEWIRSHFRTVEVLRAEFLTVESLEAHPYESSTKRMRRGALTSGVVDVYNALQMIHDMYRIFPLVFWKLPNFLVYKTSELNLLRRYIANKRDHIASLGMDGQALIKFIHEDFNAVNGALKLWRNKFMARWPVRGMISELREE